MTKTILLNLGLLLHNWRKQDINAYDIRFDDEETLEKISKVYKRYTTDPTKAYDWGIGYEKTV